MGLRTACLAPPPGVPTRARPCLCTGCRLDSTLGQGCSCLVLTTPPHSSSPSAARGLGCWCPAGPFSAPAQEGGWAAGGGPAGELHTGCREGRGGWQRPLPSRPLPETLPAASPTPAGPASPPLPSPRPQPALSSLPFPLPSTSLRSPSFPQSPRPLPFSALLASLLLSSSPLSPSPSPSPPSFLLLG